MSNAVLSRKFPVARWLAPLAIAIISGCTGQVGSVETNDPPGTTLSCSDGPQASRSPLRRLTRAEYRATIRDLLDIPAPELDDFVADETRGGFDRNVSAPSELTVEKLRASAETFAAGARERFADGCDVDESACARTFITSFGLRAYRRPLVASEIQELVGLYENERSSSDGATALELVVQTILMSPHFLYHVELGGTAVANIAQLSGYEVASRLSYFLWGTLPDDALFESAASGALDGPDGIEAEVERMLADPKAAEMLVEFERQWLELRAIDDVERDPEAFPDWSPELLQSMRAETKTFFEEVILKGDGTLETLLTAPYSYVDSSLAEHYGAEALDDGTIGVDGLVKTTLPEGERAGLLTQGLVLVTHAYPSKNSWVHRGKFVRERLLCATMPPPPANVDFSNTNDPNRLTNAECKGCHELMDPIGKAFDLYDPTGQFSTLDPNGLPIDARGEVYNSEIGTFDSIVELAAELAKDPVVHACVANTWSTYALGRELTDDACSQTAIKETFDDSGHDIRALFVAIATSDAFRFTRAD